MMVLMPAMVDRVVGTRDVSVEGQSLRRRRRPGARLEGYLAGTGCMNVSLYVRCLRRAQQGARLAGLALAP